MLGGNFMVVQPSAVNISYNYIAVLYSTFIYINIQVYSSIVSPIPSYLRI